MILISGNLQVTQIFYILVYPVSNENESYFVASLYIFCVPLFFNSFRNTKKSIIPSSLVCSMCIIVSDNYHHSFIHKSVKSKGSSSHCFAFYTYNILHLRLNQVHDFLLFSVVCFVFIVISLLIHLMCGNIYT